jgi:Zn-dependent protease with chaperone function
VNFFEHQDQAHKKTGLLIFYFVLAVLFIVILVNVVLIGVFFFTNKSHSISIQPDWIVLISAGTLALIIFGSLFKTMTLSLGGGASIAESLGGSKVSPDTSDLKERQLLNIVEEMSIASGCAVPTVYVLKKEQGLNAFAAGFKVNNAVVAVTQGCLDTLNREELQGVIGHEFSHILNGDMKLNLKLMGVLHGILLIGLIGDGILRGQRYSVRSNRKNAAGILLVGFALFVIGYAGVFFGKLIKAAVSRQREFLADASSVQFTRNPSGIANALKKIGGFVYGSKIISSKAEETSHLFFSDALVPFFSSFNFMATHPPLRERIKRVEPSFDGKFMEGPNNFSPETRAPDSRISSFATTPQKSFSVTTQHLMNQIGSLSPENLQYTFQKLSEIPTPLSNATRDTWGASAIVYGLFLDAHQELRSKQEEHLKKNAPHFILSELQKLLPLLDSLPEGNRHPILELSLPTLRNLSSEQYLNFKKNIEALIHMDGRVNRFEFVLQKMLDHTLTPYFTKVPHRTVAFFSFRAVKKQIERLLSTLAHWGNPKDEKLAFAAFEKGVYTLRQRGETFTILPPSECTPEKLDEALKILESTAPFIRQKILDSSAHCILADKKVTLEEIETFRMIAACLDCPVPPILKI